MSLADAVLSALRGFATEVSTWTNQGTLTSISGHIAQIENAAATDLHAGEIAAKAVLADLYSALHGHAPEAQPVPTPPAASSAPETVSSSSASQAAPSLSLQGEAGPEIPPQALSSTSTVSPDPTPSTVSDDSSTISAAPSETPSDVPPAPAAPGA
jgi:hypothetical protein